MIHQGIRSSRELSSSDEYLSIKEINTYHTPDDDVNSYDSLQRQTVVACEFCDEAFLSRYDHIVHNATHIIIPLLKENVMKCIECSKQYKTQEKLRKHMKNKHKNIDRVDKHEIAKIANTTEIAKLTEIANTTETAQSEGIADSEIRHRNTQLDQDTVLWKHNGVNGFLNDDVIEISDEEDSKSDVRIAIKNCNINSIKNRLTFEDDLDTELELYDDTPIHIDSRTLISDLTSECKINMDPQPPWKTIDVETKSIHHDELMENRTVECRHCGSKFPNRYKAVLHETSHMNIKKRQPFLCKICDWYISDRIGTYIKHLKTHDKGEEEMLRRSKCNMCNLKYYSKVKHWRNYHKEIVSEHENGNDGVPSVSERNVPERHDNIPTVLEHENDGSKEKYRFKVEYICDFCCSFLKSKTGSIEYTCLGDYSQLGKRLRCNKCNRECFELKMVQLRTKTRDTSKHRPSKALSNYDRLKNITQRIKMMKKM